MSFYKVIYKSVYLESGEDIVEVKVFLNKDNAQNYLKELVANAKDDIEKDDLNKYKIEETEDSYERYLDGYASQDNIAIWIEIDNFYDEKELKKEQDKDYEID